MTTITLRPINLEDAVDRTEALINRTEADAENDRTMRRNFSGERFRVIEDYYDWLAAKQAQESLFASFAMLDDQMFGQLEMMRHPTLPDAGYVNLVFVVPKFRRQGLGRNILDAAVSQMKMQGCGTVQLSSIAAKEDTKAFYEKCGWTNLGAHPEKGDRVILWEKKL